MSDKTTHINLKYLQYHSNDPESVESVLLEMKEPMSRDDLLTLVSKRVSIMKQLNNVCIPKSGVFLHYCSYRSYESVVGCLIMKCNSHIYIHKD